MKMRHKSSVPVLTKVNFIEDLKKNNIHTVEVAKLLNISENKISAASEMYINIDLNDYSEETFIESKEYYLIPGILTINSAAEENNSVSLPFNYQIHLMKPAEIEEHGKTVLLRYQPGESIVEQQFVEKTADVSVMERLLEGQTKYINNPEILVLALLEFLNGLDLTVLEVIVQNMFRDTEDQMIPARLTDYTSFQIFGQKKLPFVTSWVNAMSFENVKKSIQYGLISGQDAKDDPLTAIMNEKY